MLKQALATSPGRNDIAFSLVRLYMRAADFKSARQLLRTLSQNQSDAGVREQAETDAGAAVERGKPGAVYAAQRERGEMKETSSDGPPRLRGAGANSADAGQSIQVETDPFAYLQEALRPPAAGEKQIQGILLRLECDAKGIVFVFSSLTKLLS